MNNGLRSGVSHRFPISPTPIHPSSLAPRRFRPSPIPAPPSSKPAPPGFRPPPLPYPCAVVVYDIESLFAGKLHALLCREYLKGRDWFDFVYYTAMRTQVNYSLLGAALDQIGPWKNQRLKIDKKWTKTAVQTKISTTDFSRMANDVRRFFKPNELPSLELWTQSFFLEQCEKSL